MIGIVARAGASAMVMTTESLFRLGVSRVNAVVNLLRFPIDAWVAIGREERVPVGSVVLTQHGSDCPDTETLAAYADGNLVPGEQLRLETHLSLCARCRKTVALAITIVN
jgi:hypothetical protein